jgi:DNA-binding response OmpR family regulator
MEAGADDYATKPFKSLELRTRLGAARRILELEEQLLAAVQGLGRGAGEVVRGGSQSGPVLVHPSIAERSAHLVGGV